MHVKIAFITFIRRLTLFQLNLLIFSVCLILEKLLKYNVIVFSNLS